MLRGVFCTNVCSAFVEGGVVCIEVFRVQIVLNDPQSIAEALEVRDFPRAQEADRVAYVGVIGKAQDVVIGQPRLLLCWDFLNTIPCTLSNSCGCGYSRSSCIQNGWCLRLKTICWKR